MKSRVMELHRVLKPTGSMYLHCDWHAGHYLKVMCDEVFGYNNFKNEIIWHYKRWPIKQNAFQRMHDVIFFYQKSQTEGSTFNTILGKRAESTLRRWKDKKIVARHDEAGNRIPSISQDDSSEGVAIDDVWDIPIIAPSAKERLGYPTQKPEMLLERIIKASSNKGDIILDAFCGCGTALAVAQQLGRHWIGIDISPSAIALIKNRLNKIGVSENDIDIIGMPQKAEDLKKFKPYEFQYWAINEMHATPSPRKSGDMGIDGFSFLNHIPIQVKQSEHIGRNVVDNFETALKRYYKHKTQDLCGYIVAFSFGKGVYEEVVRAKKDGFIITLVTVQDILDKRFPIAPLTTEFKQKSSKASGEKELF